MTRRPIRRVDQQVRYRLTERGEAAVVDHPPVLLRRGRPRSRWVITDRGRAALDQHPT